MTQDSCPQKNEWALGVRESGVEKLLRDRLVVLEIH